jgi:hypothetical protein
VPVRPLMVRRPLELAPPERRALPAFAWLRLVGLRFAPLLLERAEPFLDRTALLRGEAADFEPFGAREERDEALRDAPAP